MLVIQRKIGERILIGDDIEVMLVDIRDNGKKVRLGITAPRQVNVVREELTSARLDEHPVRVLFNDPTEGERNGD